MTETPASALDTAVQAAEKPPAEPSDAQPAVDEAPGSAESGETPKEPTRRDKRAERRIGKLSKDLAKEREEKAELTKRLDAVEAKVNAEPKPERPNRDSYESVEEYEDALLDYRDKLREPEPSTEAEPKDDARTQRFVSFAAEMSKKEPAFADVLNTADFPCDGPMLDNIMEMDEDGAKVFAHLQGHKDEAARLLALPPERQADELDKIADNLASGIKASDPVPEPIDPVSGSDEPPVNTATMSDDQAVKHDLELMKRRKRGR